MWLMVRCRFLLGVYLVILVEKVMCRFGMMVLKEVVFRVVCRCLIRVVVVVVLVWGVMMRNFLLF